jgi:ankyrin repeat protein
MAAAFPLTLLSSKRVYEIIEDFDCSDDSDDDIDILKDLLEEERGGDPRLVHTDIGCPEDYYECCVSTIPHSTWPPMRPLAFAALRGKNVIVQYLIDKHRAEVEHQTRIKQTALHLAACTGDADVIRSLLQRGANPMALDYAERTPLHYSIIDVIDVEDDVDNEIDAIKVVKALLDTCDDPIHINHMDCDSFTALSLAGMFGCASIVSELVSRGTDWTVRKCDTYPYPVTNHVERLSRLFEDNCVAVMEVSKRVYVLHKRQTTH